MKLLLDTHVLLWLGKSMDLLPSATVAMIRNPANDIFVSIVSFYEIAIKQNIGKLTIDKSMLQLYKDTLADNIEVLPIAPTYLASLSSLPIIPNHKDPFDRLIIATAIIDKLSIVSIDSKFELYKELVNIIW